MSSTAATKAEFSGPLDLITMAHKAADPKGRVEGDKWMIAERGAWSEWLCAAIKEKLVRDGNWPSTQNELKSELLAAAELVGIDRALEAVRREAIVTAKSKPAKHRRAA